MSKQLLFRINIIWDNFRRSKTVFGNFFIFFGGRVHFTTYAVFHVDHAGTKIFPKNRPEVGTNRTFIEIGHFPDLGHTWS